MAETDDRPVAGIPVAGSWRLTDDVLTIRSPYSGKVVAEVAGAGPQDIRDALAAAASSFDATRRTSGEDRARVLETVSRRIAEERETMARTITLQAGKTIRAARAEADWSSAAFAAAAAEALAPIADRTPLGPVVAIAALGAPLASAAVKLAAAIAAGSAIVLQPPGDAPTPALQLAGLIRDAGWPAEAVSIVTATDEDVLAALSDERVRAITFTGSAAAGHRIGPAAPNARVTLEPGGTVDVIVHDDADLDHAADRVVVGAFEFEGQSGLAVRRVHVARGAWDRFTDLLMDRLEALELGDPGQEETHLGPMIDRESADRAEALVRDAVAAGATTLFPAGREKNVVGTTVLCDARIDMAICRVDAVGPMVCLWPYDDLSVAIRAVGEAASGLAVGVFSRDVGRIAGTLAALDGARLVVNEVPAWWADRGLDHVTDALHAELAAITRTP